jgi:hypothetical protein
MNAPTKAWAADKSNRELDDESHVLAEDEAGPENSRLLRIDRVGVSGYAKWTLDESPIDLHEQYMATEQ